MRKNNGIIGGWQTSLVNIKFSQMLLEKQGNWKPETKLCYFFKQNPKKIVTKRGFEYYFCENIVYSEGHQTKPAEDNVHIPQTNVFNVKQF